VIGLNDFLRASFGEEVHLELTTSGKVSKCVVTVGLVGDYWRLSIGVSEEDSHPLVFLLSLDESKWMDSVSLFSTSSIIVLTLSSIGPHSPCSWNKREFSLSFTESVDSTAWHLKIKLHEFVSHNKVRAVSENINNIWLSCASKLEAEWLLIHFETSCIKCHVR
jgi:hypothetical protein